MTYHLKLGQIYHLFYFFRVATHSPLFFRRLLPGVTTVNLLYSHFVNLWFASLLATEKAMRASERAHECLLCHNTCIIECWQHTPFFLIDFNIFVEMRTYVCTCVSGMRIRISWWASHLVLLLLGNKRHRRSAFQTFAHRSFSRLPC